LNIAQKETKSWDEENLDRLLYKLDLEMRRMGRVNVSQVETIIKNMKQANFCTSTQALLLIRTCGRALSDENKSDRRERMQDLVPFLKSVLDLDVSHYNAILKVNLENEQSIDVFGFLGEMEQSGVPANRVTYQHLIGLYCMEGNIGGATTVLEQMKEEDMAINESVFHALLMGHGINKDKEMVEEMMEVMEKSGLLIGAETYVTLLIAAAKARDWERVEELLVEANNKSIRLDTGNYFKVITALCENGMTEQAKPLIGKIPMRAGYFMELRGHLPQIIMAGQPDLAFEVFNGFKSMGSEEKRNMSNHGMFMVRALVQSDTDPDKMADHISQMVSNGYTDALGIFLTEAMGLGKEEHMRALVERLKGTTDLKMDQRAFFNSKMHDTAALASAIKVVKDLGFRIDMAGLCNSLIRREMDLDKENPGETVYRLKSEVPDLMFNLLQDKMIQVLLETCNKRYLMACTGFMLNAKIDNVSTERWRLARSYLKTQSLDDLISLIFVAKLKVKDKPRDMEALYNVLLELQEADGNEILPVVKELNKHKLGVPKAIADKINDNSGDKELKDLLEVAVKDFESDYWTEEVETAFLEKRKKLHTAAMKSEGYLTPSNDYRKYLGYFEIPEDLDDMLRIKNILKKRDVFNPRLADAIIRGAIAQGELEQALAELKEAQQVQETFKLNPVTLDSMVSAYLNKDDVEGAVKVFLSSQINFFCNTLTSLLESLAQKGRHEEVLEMLKTDFQDLEIINEQAVRYTSLLDIYRLAGDSKNLEKVVDTIIESRIKGRYQVRPLLHSLVAVHLVNNNVPAAIDTFERLVKQHRCLPGKFELLTRLVQDENVEDLQKVVDLSISVLGEELSLYDLTMIFLLEGRRAQAKKMLDTPGLMYNDKAVENMMNKFVEDKRLDCLEDLIKLSRNIFGCDRDLMYTKWVEAVSGNAKTVNEIWIEIQEEGHAPSVKLKTEIAKALRNGNLPIPFVTTDLDLDVARVAPKGAAGKAAKKQEPKRVPEKSKKEAVNKEPSAVDKAIASGDMEALLALLKADQCPMAELRIGLKYLVDNNSVDSAMSLIKEKGYMPRKLEKAITSVMEALLKTDRTDDLDAFLAGMTEEQRKMIRTDRIKRNLQMSASPDKFLDVISSCTEPGQLRVKFSVLEAAFSQDNKLHSKLEELVNTGSTPACVVLGRYACGRHDAETLAKCWSRHEGDTLTRAKDLVIDIHSEEKLRWVCSTLNQDPEVVRFATNMCLANSSPDHSLQILYGVQQGLSLDNVNTTTLKKVAAIKDYKHSQQAQLVLQSRNESKNLSP